MQGEKKFKVTIVGVTPLLMNKPKEYGFDSTVAKKVPLQGTDEAKKAALDKIYSIKGKAYQPADHLRGALVNAGKDLRVKGKGKSTYSKMIASMVRIEPDAIMHKHTEFDIHSVFTVNPNTRGRNMTYRPRLQEWELSFDIIAEDEIPTDVLKEVLDRAGKYWGIGDWRPGTKGIHGKFMVTEFKEVK